MLKTAFFVEAVFFMATENKYYYVKPKANQYSNRSQTPFISLWNKKYVIYIDEPVDYSQYLDLSVDKLQGEDFPKPKSSEYESVKPILQELFEDYHTAVISGYNKYSFYDENEYYLVKHSKTWYEIVSFNPGGSDRESFKIDFRDSIEELWLTINKSRSFKSRPSARKNGELIKKERFLQFYNLTMIYISELESILIQSKEFIKNIYSLIDNNEKTISFNLTTKQSFNDLLENLSKRKKALEKRLIENDTDSKITRTKIRGEIDGVKYAINAIKTQK